MSGKNARWLCAVLCITVTAYSAGRASYYSMKAELAQWLLLAAWEKSTAAEIDIGEWEGIRPWPWADIYPVAKLIVPRLGEEQIVLSGHSGEAMSFGPGMIAKNGAFVLAGHRDSHFAYMSALRKGDVLQLQTADHHSRTFKVAAFSVVDSDFQPDITVGSDTLVLTTCYPFQNATPGGSQRYLVTAYAM